MRQATKNVIQRNKTAIDANLNCLIGDGERAKDALFKIKSGILKGPEADKELKLARYQDWLATRSSQCSP